MKERIILLIVSIHPTRYKIRRKHRRRIANSAEIYINGHGVVHFPAFKSNNQQELLLKKEKKKHFYSSWHVKKCVCVFSFEWWQLFGAVRPAMLLILSWLCVDNCWAHSATNPTRPQLSCSSPLAWHHHHHESPFTKIKGNNKQQRKKKLFPSDNIVRDQGGYLLSCHLSSKYVSQLFISVNTHTQYSSLGKKEQVENHLVLFAVNSLYQLFLDLVVRRESMAWCKRLAVLFWRQSFWSIL